MSWTALKAAIAEVIKTNGKQEITGYLLQQEIFRVIDSVGGPYGYLGKATLTTNPGTQDGNVYYLADEVGVYTNFGGLEITDSGIYTLSKAGGAWTLETISRKEIGKSRRTGGDTTLLAVAGQYYKIKGEFTDDALNYNFVTSSDGVVTYTGKGGTFPFNGSSDASIDKVARLTYILYKNGQPVLESETPVDFKFTNASANLSITDVVKSITGDRYEIYAKSSVANTVLTPNTLKTNFVS